MQHNNSSSVARNAIKQTSRHSLESWSPAECMQHLNNLAKIDPKLTHSSQQAKKQHKLDQLLQRMCQLVPTCQPSQLSALASTLSDLHAEGWPVNKPTGSLPSLPGLLLKATSKTLHTFSVPDFCVVSQALTDVLGPQPQLQGLALELCWDNYPYAAALTDFEKVYRNH